MSDLGFIGPVAPGQAGATSGAARAAPAGGLSAFLALLDAIIAGDGAAELAEVPGAGLVDVPAVGLMVDADEAAPPPQGEERITVEEGPSEFASAAWSPDDDLSADDLEMVGEVADADPPDQADRTLPEAAAAAEATPASSATTLSSAPPPPTAAAPEASVAKTVALSEERPNRPDHAGGPDRRSASPRAPAEAPGHRVASLARSDGGHAIADAARAISGQGSLSATITPRPELVSTALATVQEIGGSGSEPRLALPVQTMPAQAAELPASAAGAARLALPAVAMEIVAQARSGNRQFEIRLEPPELGRIEVRLDFRQDGSMTAKLVVDRPETLDMLARDARALEKTLQANGLKLEDGAVHYQLRDHSAFARGNSARSDGAGQGSDAGSGEHEEPEDAAAPVRAWRALARGGVDMTV